VQGVAGGIGIDDAGRVHDDYLDRLGHGTAVTAVIREKAPAAQIWAIKLFDRELNATGTALVAALRWAIAHRAHFINLSLGTTNPDHESDLAQAIDEANSGPSIIVCAAPVEGRRWLPGALDGVVRVQADMSIERDTYETAVGADGVTIVRASGYPRPIPGVAPDRNLKGQSFAVANVCGLLARAWPAVPEWCAQNRAGS
jgi:subtilisin family serine protease